MTLHARAARLLLLLLVASPSAIAVSPLSPRFDLQTHARVLEELQRANVPEVGQNSVVIAVLGALGMAPQLAVYNYEEPYPHLPVVTASSQLKTPGCASLEAVVGGAAAAGYSKVLLSGTFCLVGPARWSSVDVTANAAAPR